MWFLDLRIFYCRSHIHDVLSALDALLFILRPPKWSKTVLWPLKYLSLTYEHLESRNFQIKKKKKIFPENRFLTTKNPQFWGHFQSFFTTELNFVRPDRPIYVLYCQMSATSLLPMLILTLEYILETLQAVLAEIFEKKRWGGKKGGVFPPQSWYSRVCSRRVMFS